MTSPAQRAQTKRESRLVLAAGAVAGVVSAGVALGVAELVAHLVNRLAAPIVAVGGAVIDATPEWLKSFAIRTFGTNDKPILIGTIFLALVVVAALAGVIAVRRPVVGLAGVSLIGGVGAVAAVTRPTATLLFALPSILGAVAGSLALLLILRSFRRAPEPVAEPEVARDQRTTVPVGERLRTFLVANDRKGSAVDRRTFLATTLGAAAVGAAAGGGGRALLGKRLDVTAARSALRLPKPTSPAVPVPPGTDLRIAGLSPFRTSNEEFYRVDTALIVPQLSSDDWKLRIHGMVDREIELDFAGLLDRDLIERDITLTCVSNEVGGPYAGTARWLGAPLADLLREAGVRPGADQLLSRSVDGMTIGTPTAVVMDGRDAMLAVGMNGEPLPATHGFPVRMVVPGLYGYVSATKWLVDLELTTFAKAKPYWVRRGWAPTAPIKTMSRIDTPRPLQKIKAGKVAVAGVAWAQHRGVAAVELRVNEGEWQQARLAAVPSVDTWRQWVYEWDAVPGNYTLEVRATDRAGKTQPAKRVPPFPSGATGWHSTVVTVV